MSFLYNPWTGGLDKVATSSGGGGGGTVTEAEQAKRLIITRKASGTLSAMRLVRPLNSTHVMYATNNDSLEAAEVLGVTLTAATDNQDVEILIFGALSDASFNFTVNTQLYLGLGGSITDAAPIAGYSLEIGRALGGTDIFLDRKNIVTL